MPAITTNDLKTGITLELDNGLFQVVEFQHVKPGKGGAFVRTKLRNVKTGNVFDRTFNAGIRVEQAIVDRKDMQFLYRDGDDYVFMNNQSYEQVHVRRQHSATSPTTWSRACRPARVPQGRDHRRRDPGVGRAQGRRHRTRCAGRPGVGARKPATLETGKVVQVPLFVEIGDSIKVDTAPASTSRGRVGWTAPTSVPTPGSGRCTCSTRRTRRDRPGRRSTARCSSPTS